MRPLTLELNSASANRRFLLFAGWFVFLLIVLPASNWLAESMIPRVALAPPSAGADIYSAARKDLVRSVSHVVPLLLCVGGFAFATAKASERVHGFVLGLTCVFGSNVVHAALLVALCPGLLTGTLTGLRWSTPRDYDAAHLDWWSYGLFFLAMLLTTRIATRRRRLEQSR